MRSPLDLLFADASNMQSQFDRAGSAQMASVQAAEPPLANTLPKQPAGICHRKELIDISRMSRLAGQLRKHDQDNSNLNRLEDI